MPDASVGPGHATGVIRPPLSVPSPTTLSRRQQYSRNQQQENRQEGLDRLIPRTVFYHGADLLTVGTDGLQTAAARISTSLQKFLDMRIQTE